MNQVPRDVPPYSRASPELSVLKKGETQITQHAESPEPSLSYLHYEQPENNYQPISGQILRISCEEVESRRSSELIFEQRQM